MAAGDNVKKPSIIRWHGVLDDRNRTARMVVLSLLAVVCMSLSFSQLGFLGIGLPGEYEAYAIILLLPIAVGALLLGIVPGFVLGLIAGAMLYIHAIVMPLDFYELTFVTPVSSIVMLAASGLLLGFSFAVALRKDPHVIRRVVYIALICSFVSFLYSLGFVINVMIQVAVDLVNNDLLNVAAAEANEIIYYDVARAAFRMGDVGLQMMVDAVLMTLSCYVADILARKTRGMQRQLGLRALFATWLSVVVLFAFLLTAPASFAAITQDEMETASATIDSEITYLCNQIEDSDRGADGLTAALEALGIEDADFSKLSEEEFSGLLDVISIDGLLRGYSKEVDGTIVIAAPVGEGMSNGYVPDSDGSANADYAADAAIDAELIANSLVILSDDERFAKGDTLSDDLSGDVIDAVQYSLEDGAVERIVYDGADLEEIDTDVMADHVIGTHIAYLQARMAGGYLVFMMMPSSLVFAERASVMTWATLSSFILLLAVFVVTAILLSRVVVRRIDETNGVLARVTGGDLDAKVDIRDTREFDSLSNGINETVGALKGWIAEAETRIDAELATAKAIQESALPRTFPPFPDITRFDIYALMHAAKEVGGDFYDFFLIGDDAGPDKGKLAFVVADVSGKGVPAALFMMKAKTQLRDYLASGMSVGEAVENANRQLCDGNDAGMFVTAWVGVLDYATGHVDYVNAGHNPPLLWRDGAWEWLKKRSGVPLGLFDGLPYDEFSLECNVGAQFLLYSDGVTEAMNVNGELYGEERLEALLDENFTLHPRRLVETVRGDVARHAAGADPSDDITILSLEVGVPPEVTASLIVPADVAELPRVYEFIHTELDRRLCPVRAQKQLDIAVEELFVNVCHYAYGDDTPPAQRVARINYTYSADPPSVKVQIADDGVPYNPLAKPDAVTPDDIMDVPIGGLGILMAKRSVDDMSYERIDGSNIVTIAKAW